MEQNNQMTTRHETLDLSNAPTSFYKDAKIDIDHLGMPYVGSGLKETLNSVDHRPLVVDIAFRDHNLIHHYFHFMEMIIGAFSIVSSFLPNAKIERVHFGTQRWNNVNQNSVQMDALRRIFGPVTICDAENPTSSASPYLLIVDRFLFSDNFYNKYWEPYFELCEAHMPAFKTLIIGKSTAPQGYGSGRPIASYVKRPPPRCLSERAEGILFEELNRADFIVEPVDFSHMSFSEQIACAQRSYFMIGVHGNGLTNCLWQQAGAWTLEIFPNQCHHYDYQFSAEIAGTNYSGFEGVEQNGFIYTNRSRHGPAYGNPVSTIESLPRRDLRALCDKVIKAYEKTASVIQG